MIYLCLCLASIVYGFRVGKVGEEGGQTHSRAGQVGPQAVGPAVPHGVRPGGPAVGPQVVGPAGPQGVRPGVPQTAGQVGHAVKGPVGPREIAAQPAVGPPGHALIDVTQVLARRNTHYCCCNGFTCHVYEHDIVSSLSPIDVCNVYGYGKNEQKHCAIQFAEAAQLYNSLGMLSPQFCPEVNSGHSLFNQGYMRSGSLNEKLQPKCKNAGYAPAFTSSCIARMGPDGLQGAWDPYPRCEAKSDYVHVYLLAYPLIPLPALPPSLRVHHSATLICPQRGGPKAIKESEAADRTEYSKLFVDHDCLEWSFPDYRGIVMNAPGEYVARSTLRVRYVGKFRSGESTDYNFMLPYKQKAEQAGFQMNTYNRMEHNCNSFSIFMLRLLGKNPAEVMGCESPKVNSLPCIAVENRKMPGNKREDLDGWIAIQDKAVAAHQNVQKNVGAMWGRLFPPQEQVAQVPPMQPGVPVLPMQPGAHVPQMQPGARVPPMQPGAHVPPMQPGAQVPPMQRGASHHAHGVPRARHA
eukprot:TRINITY_DN2651_c0_g2_i1.p1 TRINITY_DN2651_c0_g2~~TRINITY_DN2651_c0_g2_i1.p1  ORF type:complete len:522 (+),score=18.18 TRINITY_DN2651_c0_g2_i1:60-1625(+)